MKTYKVPKWVIEKLSVDNNLKTIVKNTSYRYKNFILFVSEEANFIGRDYFNNLISELKKVRVD